MNSLWGEPSCFIPHRQINLENLAHLVLITHPAQNQMAMVGQATKAKILNLYVKIKWCGTSSNTYGEDWLWWTIRQDNLLGNYVLFICKNVFGSSTHDLQFWNSFPNLNTIGWHFVAAQPTPNKLFSTLLKRRWTHAKCPTLPNKQKNYSHMTHISTRSLASDGCSLHAKSKLDKT